MRHIRNAIVAAAALIMLIATLMSLQYRSSGETERSMSGEIVRYDVAARLLVLRSNGEDDRFVVPVGTAVHAGARRLSVTALPSAVGHRAKVWYRDARGRRTASQIRIASPMPAGNPSSRPPSR